MYVFIDESIHGDFYTPRAITEIMTEITNPRLGERLLDPACGTGGFLTSAIENIRRQDVKDVDDLKTLEENGYNLDIKNLHTPEATHQHSSDELVTMLHESFQKSDILLAKLRKELAHG